MGVYSLRLVEKFEHLMSSDLPEVDADVDATCLAGVAVSGDTEGPVAADAVFPAIKS